MISTVKKQNDITSNNFTNYKVTYEDGIIWYVPHSEDNRHYREIQEWVAEGNTIEEAD